MNGFFKSRAFVILLTLVILLAGIPTILTAMGQGNLVKDAAMTVISPLMNGASSLGRAFRGFGDYFTEYDRLKEENKLLSERVKLLEEQVYNAELIESENEWLRTYLGTKRANTEYTFCDANLIGSDGGGHIGVFTLDRGSTSGIKVGMPVLDNNGIIGRVTEVGFTFCRVSTVINYDSSIGAYVERSGEVGIVGGSFKYRKEGKCVLEYLKFGADVEVGDKVYSSGLGSVYPRGMFIGTVSEIAGDPYNHTKTAVIEPAADLVKTAKVMILTSYDVK